MAPGSAEAAGSEAAALPCHSSELQKMRSVVQPRRIREPEEVVARSMEQKWNAKAAGREVTAPGSKPAHMRRHQLPRGADASTSAAEVPANGKQLWGKVHHGGKHTAAGAVVAALQAGDAGSLRMAAKERAHRRDRIAAEWAREQSLELLGVTAPPELPDEGETYTYRTTAYGGSCNK